MITSDKISSRTVLNQLKLIREHLEEMQRDAHGLEYEPWKQEVDGLWKGVFDEINGMSPEPQHSSLERIRELWTMYISHYSTESG